MKTSITLDEWQQALLEVANDFTEKVPDGWITMAEFAKRINKSTSYGSKLMRDLVRSGKAESRKFTIAAGDRVFAVPHYRIKAKK